MDEQRSNVQRQLITCNCAAQAVAVAVAVSDYVLTRVVADGPAVIARATDALTKRRSRGSTRGIATAPRLVRTLVVTELIPPRTYTSYTCQSSHHVRHKSDSRQ